MKIKSTHITYTPPTITLSERNIKNNHNSGIVFFSGYNGPINTIFLLELEATLFKIGLQAMIINNSIMRNKLCSDLRESPKNLNENFRRAIELSKLISNAGWIVLADLISFNLSGQNIEPEFQISDLHEIELSSNSRRNTLHIFTKVQKDCHQKIPAIYKNAVATFLSINIDSPDRSLIIKIISQHIKEIFNQKDKL